MSGVLRVLASCVLKCHVANHTGKGARRQYNNLPARDMQQQLSASTLMTIVATSATSSMDVRCMKCATVSLDEQAFIRAVAIYQAGFPLFDASEIFTPWLPPAARRLAKPHIAKLSRKFQHAGLRLSCEAGPGSLLRDDAGVAAPDPVTA